MQPKRLHSSTLNRIMCQKLLHIVFVYIFIPLIVVALICLYIYRRLIEIALKVQFKDKFTGLLRGTDCVWAVEDTTTLSVINILMTLEKTARNSNAIFLKNFRNLMKDRVVSNAVGTTLEKMLYRRCRRFGYYYWEKCDEIDLNDRIRWLECENANCDGSCDDFLGESFRWNLGNLCNKPLPDDHTASWEILVGGGRCPRSGSCYLRHLEEDCSSPEMRSRSDTLAIPIIFRFHHSLGDGMALVKLLLMMIAEENGAQIEDTTSTNENRENVGEIVSPSRNLDKNFQKKMERLVSQEDILMATSMPFTYTMRRIWRNTRNYFRAFFKDVTIDSTKRQVKMLIDRARMNLENFATRRIYGGIKKVARQLMVLLSAPEYLIQQASHSADDSALHGPPQTGEKMVSYWLENDIANDESSKLFTKIRAIRKSMGVAFGDVVLAALSASLHKYYLRINEPAPDALTAIVPIRMPTSNEGTILDNMFSVGVLRICISNVNGRTVAEPNRDSRFLERLQDIAKANNELKRGPDYLLNFWIMKYLSAVLPAKILPVAFRSYSTMAFSNICGPPKIRILGNSVSNIIFWTPNKSTTALGFGMLSYGDNLYLSLIADKSIVKDEKYFAEILRDTVHEIDTVYNNIIMLTRTLK